MSEQPNKPSWVDRLTDAIDRQRAPAWVIYLVVAGLLVAIFVGIQTWQGAYRENGFFPWHIFVGVQPLYGVMVIHYLDFVAANAMRQFRPALKGGEAEYEEALYRITHLPARQTLLAGMLGALFAIFSSLSVEDIETIAGFPNVAPTSISVATHIGYITVSWIGYGMTIYHMYHQLKVINQLYTSRADIDPFHPEPLYALADITSRSSLLILVAIYGWFLAITAGPLTEPLSNPNYIATNVFWVGLGLLVFILPLWGAHQLLVEAKNDALEANARSYKAASEELHRTVLAKEIETFDVWHKAIAALDVERRHIDKMATWPWSPGAFRNLLLALVLPILVWIIQFGLQRVLE